MRVMLIGKETTRNERGGHEVGDVKTQYRFSMCFHVIKYLKSEERLGVQVPCEQIQGRMQRSTMKTCIPCLNQYLEMY
jgi:hypothetical protein